MEPLNNSQAHGEPRQPSLQRNMSQPDTTHPLMIPSEFPEGGQSNEYTFQNAEHHSQYSYEDPDGEEPFADESADGELYHEEEISDSASVVTLYLSQPEASPTVEEEKKASDVPKDETIRYIPASEDLRGERVKTAPPRPPTEIEELRGSKQFLNLETCMIAGSQLIQKSDGKFDLESPEGQDNCKKFLQELEKLFESFKASHVSRAYRNKFSQAYRVLYIEGSLCYLTEILDSAQEGIFY